MSTAVSEQVLGYEFNPDKGWIGPRDRAVVENFIADASEVDEHARLIFATFREAAWLGKVDITDIHAAILNKIAVIAFEFGGGLSHTTGGGPTPGGELPHFVRCYACLRRLTDRLNELMRPAIASSRRVR